MMFAARKLQGIGLIMLLTMFALIAYPISLRVSATRAQLAQVEREIARTRDHNRMLEGDIAVLANARQLDRWNTEFLGYVAPGANQYLAGERALASLDRLQPALGAAVPRPVLVSMQAVDPDRANRDAEQSGPAPDAVREVAMVDRQAMTASVIRDIGRVLPASTDRLSAAQ